MRSRKYRIKSKFRFTTAIAVTFILLGFMTNTVLGLNDASSLTRLQPPIEVQIAPGDSLWALASEYGPDHTDIREVINDICKLNQIAAEHLYPGQMILIPDYS
ncbi:LysM peptidoglycan-binding domain-containing protein [Aminipila butyrica]|uniref:LysM peptidoglycan-binding domain-containing protein n=1 Tax=Aminipila butyrica TaxID=433296 RepID=A0A858BWZ3_9FIRM|nr:LysM peptidoglycan-binding domain-containing protein [Aminipila butyrica]QIB69420.1 LysM peptidoglycan-binding domain-containing protein [Aminipila butyrica]